MRQLNRYMFLPAAFLLLSLNTPAQSIPVHAGTLVQCTLDEPNFSAKTVQIGDPVICYLRPHREFGMSIFPRGSYLIGRFADSQDPGRFAGKGWLKLEFDRLILSPTTEVPVATKVVAVRRYRTDSDAKMIGRGHPRRDAIEWMLPVLWPVKLMLLPARGPYPALKGEVPITLRLMDDVDIPCTVIRSPSTGQIDGNRD